MQPWVPELHVTPELATALIGAQFQIPQPLRLRAFDSGWDNVVYEVNDRWLFRFPQRQVAVEGVVREMQCLPILRASLVDLPDVQFFGRPSEAYPWPFFGYLPVVGREPAQLPLSDASRVALAPELGARLARLHSPETRSALKFDLPQDPLGRLNFAKRSPMTEERLRTLEAAREDLPFQTLREIYNAALGTPILPCTSVVHGDLHFRHLILDERHELSGLIDWGDLHLNDPAVDLQLYWSFFPEQGRRAFRESYGLISEHQLVQARAFAVFVNVALLVSAVAQGKERIAEEARRSLRFTARA